MGPSDRQPMAAASRVEEAEIRVLCVDDDPDFRELVRIFLGERREAIAVETVPDGDAVVERLGAGGIDCVISDYRMPRMDGLELLAAVREGAPDLPFIMFTARGGEDVAAEAVSAGVTDYIQKSTDPAQFDLLANRVRNVVERHRARVQYRDVFDSVSEAVLVIDPTRRTVVDANRRACELWEYDEADLVGRPVDDLRVPPGSGVDGGAGDTVADSSGAGGSTGDRGGDPDHLVDNGGLEAGSGPSTAGLPAAGGAPLAPPHGGAPERADVAEWRCVASDGHRFWGAVSRKRATIGGRERTLAIVRDVTRERVRQRQLDDLLATVRELLVVETEREIAEVVEETVVDRLRFADARTYLLDRSAGGFRVPGDGAGSEDLAGEPNADESSRDAGVTPEDVERLWDALDSGELVVAGRPTLDDPMDAGRTVPAESTVLYLPLGEVGVLRCEAAAETDPHDVELAALLGTFAAGAVDRCRREAQLRKRETELRDQRDELLSLDHVNEVIRDINRALVSVSSRSGIEQLVCEKFVSTDPYRFAWLGEYDSGAAALRPSVSAGRNEGYLPERLDLADEDAIARAVEERTVVVVDRITPDTVPAGRYRLARERGLRSVAFVPVVHQNVLYRLLAVYAEEPHAFAERERAVLGELGETIGHALAAAEWRSARISETVVELDLAVEHAGPLFDLTDGGEARVDLADLRETDAGTLRVFARTRGLSFEAFEAAVGAVATLGHATLVAERDGGPHVAYTVRTGPLLRAVTTGGVSLRSGTLADGRGSFKFTVPAGTDVRWLVDQLGTAFDRVELVGRRDRPHSAPADRLEDLLAPLTDRQQEALRTAFHAGYFATPREASGSDVAELLGVTQPTFNEHLRTAERRVYEELLGS